MKATAFSEGCEAWMKEKNKNIKGSLQERLLIIESDRAGGFFMIINPVNSEIGFLWLFHELNGLLSRGLLVLMKLWSHSGEFLNRWIFSGIFIHGRLSLPYSRTIDARRYYYIGPVNSFCEPEGKGEKWKHSILRIQWFLFCFLIMIAIF